MSLARARIREYPYVEGDAATLWSLAVNNR